MTTDCMPPENVCYPPSQRSKNYVKNTLTKCYNPSPKASEIKESMTRKKGFRRYICNETALYRGWWKNNVRNGLGTQIDKTKGEVYEGGFLDDVRSGYGVISNLKPNGIQELFYEGDFANGAPNGKGELHTATYHYVGKVINGKASGVGIAWYNDGTIYSGTWFNGKRMGQGMQLHKNKNRYEGNWYDDKKHGYGQYCFFDRGQALEGIWVADVCIRGTIRNIKYRQTSINPTKYAIPMLQLKDWTTSYYLWEQEALASAGKYVREDLGIKDYENIEDKENDSVKSSFYCTRKDSDQLAHQIDLLNLPLYSKYPASIADVQPCIIFR